VTFTDQSTNSPTSWSWNFGDGQTSTAQNPSHTYTTPATYTVSLTATNAGGGNTLTMTNYITVTAPLPVAAFTATPTSGAASLAVTFTDQSVNFPTSWSWNFGDGQPSTSQNPSHTYDTPGTYTVTLTATNAAGSDGETKTGYITVTVPVPVAGFSGTPTTGPIPLMVVFTDQSTNSPTSWSWDFGDGNTVIGVSDPSHTYIAQGSYMVTLTVTNDGGSDSEIKVGYVTVGNPTQSLVFITSTDTDRKTAKKGDMVNVSIRLIAGEAAPTDGMILLDRSGDSMRTCMENYPNTTCRYYRWDYAKEGALLLAGNMSPRSNMGVSWFATRGGIAHTVDNSPVQVMNEIQALDYVPYSYTYQPIDPYTGPGTGGQRGMSNLRDGLYKTIDYMDGVSQQALSSRAVIVFTDGLYNWYGNPIANGRGYAIKTKYAKVEWITGLGYREMVSGMTPYDPAAVTSEKEDWMWWDQAASCNGWPVCDSGILPGDDYTFYNDIQVDYSNGGWLNFTGNSWDGETYLQQGPHLGFPHYNSAGDTYVGLWPIPGSGGSGCTVCECAYKHCDFGSVNEAYQVDVCDPTWPYIDSEGIPHGDCEQTKQNMTIFARDSNIRLYTVVIRTNADPDTSMPTSAGLADDMMKTLAYTTGGKYYAVHDRADLYAAIEDISRELASSATKDLTMELEDTSVDVNSLLTVNTGNQVFAHHHLQDISTTTQSWDQYGTPIDEIATIGEGDDWQDTHQLNYFVDDLSVGDTFQMNFTVQVNARGRINAIGPDSRVTFKDGYELALPPTYIDVENAPPVFDPVEEQTVDRMETLTFTISATDADNDPLTYAKVSIPQGATFDINTLTFEWTPENKGSYVATFSVTDGLATVTQSVPITVTDLRPKIIIR
jgi:PKD repeat protein